MSNEDRCDILARLAAEVNKVSAFMGDNLEDRPTDELHEPVYRLVDALNAKRAGEALIAARALVGREQWPTWCHENLETCECEAEKAIVLAENFDRLVRAEDVDAELGRLVQENGDRIATIVCLDDEGYGS